MVWSIVFRSVMIIQATEESTYFLSLEYDIIIFKLRPQDDNPDGFGDYDLIISNTVFKDIDTQMIHVLQMLMEQSLSLKINLSVMHMIKMVILYQSIMLKLMEQLFFRIMSQN